MGEIDNTLIVVTADHGDMLGELGLWYKMSFFEHSVRVPLIFAGPGVPQGASVGHACSLIDLTHGVATPEMPWAAMKGSGTGSDMSVYALEAYTAVRHIMVAH